MLEFVDELNIKTPKISNSGNKTCYFKVGIMGAWIVSSPNNLIVRAVPSCFLFGIKLPTLISKFFKPVLLQDFRGEGNRN